MPAGACRGNDYGIRRAAVGVVRTPAKMGTQSRPNGTRAAPPRAVAFQAHGSQRRRSRCNARISFALTGLYARTSREGCTLPHDPLRAMTAIEVLTGSLDLVGIKKQKK